MQIQAREIIILPSIILPVLLLGAEQGDHRIQTSIPLFCPFIILSSLPTSNFYDKIMGGQNDFRILVSRSRTPRWLRKSSVVGGRIMEGRIMDANPGSRNYYSPVHYSPCIFAESRARRSLDSNEHSIILSFHHFVFSTDVKISGQNNGGDKMIFVISVSRGRTPLWLRKSSVVRGRIMDGRIIGCKSYRRLGHSCPTSCLFVGALGQECPSYVRS